MEFDGYLQTISGIGITVAGFTGLIVALRARSGPLTAVEKYRVRVLLSLALGVVFLALLPGLLSAFDVSAASSWKASSATLSVYSGLFLCWWSANTWQIRKSAPEIFNWLVYWTLVAGHLGVLVLQLGYLLSLIEVTGSGAFFLALVWYLAHSAQQFSRMLFVRAKSDLDY